MDSCSCISYAYDGPQAEVFNARVVTARKKHKCGECGREILPGEKYETASGKWDDSFETYKTCADCLSVRDAFFCEDYAYGGIWEILWEHLRYINYEVSSDCLVKLTKAARDNICDSIEAWWEDHEED